MESFTTPRIDLAVSIIVTLGLRPRLNEIRPGFFEFEFDRNEELDQLIGEFQGSLSQKIFEAQRELRLRISLLRGGSKNGNR